MKNLRTYAKAMKAFKLATAALASDNAIIGVDSISGGEYTGDLLSIGDVVKTKAGNHVVLVDALSYPEHTGESGKVYKDENRFVVMQFNPDTLEFTGKRTNIGFNSLQKAEYLGDIWTYVTVREKQIADEAAAKAKAIREAKSRAVKGMMRGF